MNPTPSPSAGCRNNACDARCCVLEQTGNRRRSMRALGATNVVGRGCLTRGRAVAPQEVTRPKRVHERFAQCPSRTNPSARFGLSHAAIIPPQVFRCILPVLTAEREREGVCNVLNGLTERARARGAVAGWQNEPGHGGFSRSQNEPEHAMEGRRKTNRDMPCPPATI